MDIKKVFLDKTFVIVVLLIVILILLFTCKFRCSVSDIIPSGTKSVCGNKVCEQGAETYSNCAVDCPNCIDNNRCTSDFFNYNTQKCENNLVYSCCGNLLCEKGEGLSNCPLDCQLDITPIEIGKTNLVKNYKLYEYNNRVLRVNSIWTDSISLEISYKENESIYRVY